MKHVTTPKSSQRKFAFAAALSASLSITFPVFADDVFKADNIDDVGTSGSWVGMRVPGATDVAVWDSSIVNPLSAPNFTGAASWGGIRVSSAANESGLFSSGSFSLTIGSSGIDLSAATSGRTFVIYGPTLALTPAKGQTWSVADNATLFATGATQGVGATLNYTLGATGLGNVIYSGGTTGAILNWATTNGNDFAGLSPTSVTVLGSPFEAAAKVVPGASLGLYQANPAPDAATVSPTPASTNGNIMDFTATTTSDGSLPLNGITSPNGWFFQGFRFNTQNTRTDRTWTVNFTGNRTITPSVGVVVGSGVGAGNVVFSGTGFFRADTNRDLTLAQYNTQGDLIFSNSGGINARTASRVLYKTGPGRVIMNSGIGLNGGLYLNEGTMQFGSGGTVGAPGTGFIVNNGSLVFDRSDALTLAGVISGPGSLTKNGAGALTLSGLNTYTGVTSINGGAIVLGSASALGATPSITLNNGGLTYGSGVTTDVSAVPVSMTGGTVTINTNGNNVSFAQPIGQSGAGSLAKAGAGTLTLAGANSYTGNTSVSSGTLSVVNSSGSATGSGAVSLSSGTTLSGTGTISGIVTANTGSTIVPGGAGVGTITLGGLSLAASTTADIEFASASSYDKIVTTNSNGLTINGGALHLYAAGGIAPYATPGTYDLFQFAGSVQGTGPSALSVLNPQAGFAYTFGTSGNSVTLSIVQDAIISSWSPTGGGSWGSGASWSNGVPTSGYTAQFTTQLVASESVMLDGNRTINGAVFSSSNGYTVAQGTGGTLAFDKGASNAAMNVTAGQHVISAPVLLASNLAASTDADTGMTISGAISGPGGIIKTGPGFLDLTGSNSFTGSINVTGGVLGFAQASGLGTGAITLDGGALRYDVGNTADVSARPLTFGQNGATVDTNGNDVIWMSPVGNNGVGSFTKNGSGILALDGVNTYSGGTIVTGGTLRISADTGLSIAGTPLTLNGGRLSSGTLVLSTNGTPRPVVVGASGGSIVVDGASTLTFAGVLSGTGLLTKEGEGSLDLINNAASSTGGVSLNGGTTTLNLVEGYTAVSNTIVGVTSSQVLGTGTLSFNGGIFNSTVIDGNQLTINNPISVPTGQTGTLVLANRSPLQGAVSGAGTLNISVRSSVARTDFMNSFTGFTGTLNLLNGTANGITSTWIRLMCNNSPAFNAASFAGAVVNLAPGITFSTRTNSGGNVIQFGELHGGAGGSLTNEAGGAATYQIGALNTDSDYAGTVVSGNNPANQIVKVGTGTLTLTGGNTSTGTYTVNAGKLLVHGNSATTTAATVAVGATLGGTGIVGGAVTVNGILQPDSTGALGGSLTFNGLVTLASTALTQFDFAGASTTRINSTLDGAMTYGGALNFNFKGTVYSNSYQVFQRVGAFAGSFTGGVTVSTTTTPSAPLADNTGSTGTWDGVVDGVTFSFNPSTGVLTVTGGAVALVPSVPTGVSAVGGNAQVTLSWNAASNADSYILKRSITQGADYTVINGSVSGTTFVDSGLTNGTTYYYVVDAKNNNGLVSNDSAEVSATPAAAPVLTALEQWRLAEFGVSVDDGTVLAGDNEDFDGDGLVNLLEYALGTSPKVANASPVTVSRVGSNLVFTYPRVTPADAKLTYSVLGSSDLTSGFTAGAGSTNTVGSTSTYTDNVDVSAAGVRRFLRLSVSYTP